MVERIKRIICFLFRVIFFFVFDIKGCKILGEIMCLFVCGFFYCFVDVCNILLSTIIGCSKKFFVFLVEMRRTGVRTKVVYCRAISVSWCYFDIHFV